MYVLQYYTRGDGFKPGTWTVCSEEFKAVEDVQKLLDQQPFKSEYRIAETYTVVRYKAVKAR
jgi:hypothetical protein